ncbi:MAG: sensor histidine kinase, partial [Bacteroidia bacterium]
VLYFIIIIASIILISFAEGYMQILLNPGYEINPELYDRAFNTGIICSILTLVISSSIKVTNEWFRNQQLMKSAENEKLNAELNFLKSQVNPHFIFNALNNIYSLENKKSPDTGPAILKLSELMRYMLYETGAEFVSLEKEIEYLKNYIELQKLGLSKEIPVNFNIEGDFTNKKIRPMLLIPLVENVFKHGVSYLSNSELFILIKISGNQIEIITRNAFKDGLTRNQKEGIGLANLTKRLDLLYFGNYKMDIVKENETFITHLRIILE